MVSSVTAVLVLIYSSLFAAADAEPPNAPESHLKELRFSPDGKSILAQDDSTITVLAVKPLAILFRIPAKEADTADFTPDSKQIVFVSSATTVDSEHIQARGSSGHFEQWSVATHTRVGSTAIELPGCGTERLSPDGRFVACDQVDGIYGRFRLLDVSSGTVLLQKNHFGNAALTIPDFEVGDRYTPKQKVTVDGKLGSALVSFSPDGRFLVAVPTRAGGEDGVVWDLRAKKPVSMRGALRRTLWYADGGFYNSAPPFTFVAADRAVVSWPKAWNPKDTTVTATLASFPSGKTLLKPRIPPGPLFRAADSGFVIVRPCRQLPVCAVEISSGQVVTSETPALDVLGPRYVAELPDGKVGLYERGKGLQYSTSLQSH